MAALKPLKPLKPLRPLRGLPEPDPQRVNAQRIAVLSTKPQPRIQPQPVPHSLIAGYAVQLERIAARAYQIADSTVGAAIRRQQALAYSLQPSLRPDAEGKPLGEDEWWEVTLGDPPHAVAQNADPSAMTPAQRAAYQNHNHTPEQKRQLELPIDLSKSIETMNKRMVAYESGLDLGPIIVQHANRVETFAARVNTQMLETIGLRPIDPGTAIAKARDQWVKANAELIKSIPQDVAQRVGQVTREMVEGGARWETIAKRLQDEEGISKRRANLIARDQTSKYNGALNQAQQQAAGIEYYEWRGAMDARERPEHVAMQGQAVKWSSPPPMGHPGEAILCRCVAIPLISQAKIAAYEPTTSKQLKERVKALGPRIKDQ